MRSMLTCKSPYGTFFFAQQKNQTSQCGTGARMLRQDPVECLFQFVCSSNNHISRIHGMVERLCSTYGTPLAQQPAVAEDPLAAVATAADPVRLHRDRFTKHCRWSVTWHCRLVYMKCPKNAINLER